MITLKGFLLITTTLFVGLTSVKLGVIGLPTNLVQQPQVVAQTDPRAQEILDAHNQYRAEVNVPPLTWSESLATDAQAWADRLAAAGGGLRHSSNRERVGQGENLWAGTAGAYSYSQMVQGWGDEKQYFRAGSFPEVSSTSNWADVGHYTQIIWKNTTAIGCAVATGGGMDLLVCRYSPSGNFIGQPVY